MPKIMSPVAVAPKLVSLLTPLTNEDRMRAIRAALLLLGDNAAESVDLGQGGTAGGGVGAGGRGRVPKEQDYFAAKHPRTKGEELAVAARYREEHLGANSSTKADIETVIKAARKNFSSRNYRRDLDNAKISGLFTRGTGKDATLTDYGQKYVDALPDRDAVKALPRPRKAVRKKGRKKT